MPIQYVLIGLVVLLMGIFLRYHDATRTAAGVKLGFVVFLLFGVYAVLWPESVSVLARLVGVGRGTDLLLYGLVAGFAFATIYTCLKLKDLETRYARLARAVALRDPEKPDRESMAITDTWTSLSNGDTVRQLNQ